MRVTIKSAFVAGTMLAGTAVANAQSFDNAYFFGDSLTDCCARQRFTNGQQPNWADQLPSLIGASYTATLGNNQAVGGAQSGQNNTSLAFETGYGMATGFLPQVERFTAQDKAITSRDIAGIWIGVNDIWPSALPPVTGLNQPIGSRPAVSTFADYVAGNVRTGIDSLVEQGFRNIVLVTPYDLAESTIYATRTDSVDATTLSLATQYSEAVRDRYANMYTPGVNTFMLDTVGLLRAVQANPGLYGFDHVTAEENCSASDCTRLPLEQQNRYVFNDVIHVTSGFNQLMSAYIANMINAREGLSAQGDLGEVTGRSFASRLLGRLDAKRHGASVGEVADSPVSFFTELSRVGFERRSRHSASGIDVAGVDGDIDGITVGAEYQASSAFLVGTAVNYSTSSTDVGGRSGASLELDSYQGSVFASYDAGGFFADAALSYGVNRYDLSRPGVVDTLSASPDGSTFTATAKVGGIFAVSGVQLAPFTQLAYADVRVDSYRESGDPLLTIGVEKQSFDSLTGAVGVQISRSLSAFGGEINPYLTLTAEHDFMDGVRTLTSYGTGAPALLINTSGGHAGDNLYGTVAGGFSVELGGGLSGGVSGSTTFGRSYGNDHTMNAGLTYRF